MSKFDRIFKNHPPFIGYLTGGDGGIDYCLDCAKALVEGGVDILEIGFPFSDPIADGPVIERAHMRALKAGTTASSILEIARRLRTHTDIPLVLFSYYNPLLQRGESYLHEAKNAGFDAVLVVDLPPLGADAFEVDPFFRSLKKANLIPILLVTPSTSEERLRLIGQLSEGFIYYVSQKGTTGVRAKLAEDFSANLARIRLHTETPIVGGFGIADQATARHALQYADGFVVGSAFVKLMEQQADPSALKLLANSIDPREEDECRNS